MGFSHYLYRPKQLDKNKFSEAVKDCKKVCESIKAPITYFDTYFDKDEEGDGNIFSSNTISFNGIGEDAHEPFIVHQDFPLEGYVQWDEDKIFQFCKTARKPYDTAVVTCLIILYHYFGDEIKICSDGFPEEWKTGLQAVQDCLGYGKIPESIK